MNLSLVDLSPVLESETRHDAYNNSIEVAQHIEKLGFKRIWLAEHHNAKSFAGRTPEVLMAAIASKTSKIRVGSGSVLLNHYSAFKVAEVFSSLNELFPGRIDMGIGRATAGPLTDFALQQDRSKQFKSDSAQQLLELLAWMENDFPQGHQFSEVYMPTLDSLPKMYLLGSSVWSASAAAQLGLSYVFAAFINQKGSKEMLAHYRENFVPHEGQLRSKSPNAKIAIHIVCAESRKEARRQLAPVTLMYKHLQKGNLDFTLPAPDKAVKILGELPDAKTYEKGSGIPPKFLIGTPDEVKSQLDQIALDLAIEEVFIQDSFTDHKARLRSYELLAQAYQL